MYSVQSTVVCTGKISNGTDVVGRRPIITEYRIRGTCDHVGGMYRVVIVDQGTDLYSIQGWQKGESAFPGLRLRVTRLDSDASLEIRCDNP